MKIVLFAAALSLGGAALAQQTGTKTDARGIPVVSDAATAPSGANQSVQAVPGTQAVPAPNQSAVFATQASTKTYPPCTKGVTDGCVQTYERGVRR
jgi:hypothetical protein